MRRLVAAVTVALMLAGAAPAAAAAKLVVAPEYIGAKAQVPAPYRFAAIIGYPAQCVAGIPCWQYTKGTRSPVGTYPEAWYLHASGQRVRDAVWGFYVMNPLSGGWQHHVAAACAAQCFIDGMGSSGLGRMRPRPAFTAATWENEVALIVRAVVASGKHALPNSIGTDSGAMLAAAGQGSTESFTATNAQRLLGMGRVWVTERGDCLTKYHAYQRYAGPGDEFGCYNPPALPWDLSWL